MKDNQFVDSSSDECYIFLKENPFYAESGGQVADSGYLKNDKCKLEVLDVIKAPNGQHMVYVKVLEGTVTKGDKILTHVSKEKRLNTMKNHSSVHLLQKSLQELLGDSVHQAGSKVDDKMLRFDFNYHGRLSDELILKVEDLVNQKIQAAYETKIEYMSLDEAKKDINKFAIASVENKGSDTFRVIAATDTNIEEILGEEVSKYNEQMLKLLDKAKKIVLAAKELNIDLKFNFKIANDAPTSYKDIIINKNELESLKDSIKELEKEFIIKKNEKSISDLTSFLSIKEEINGITTIISITNDYDISTLKQIVSALSNQLDNSFILLANQNKDDSVNFIAKSTSNRVDCGMIIKELSTSCKGNGGGSKVFAQGGGTDGTNIAALLINIKEKIKKL